MRDPIDRFVSAVGEVLQRVVNGVCPGGAQCPPIDENQLIESTEWYSVAERAGFNFSAEVLPKLMAAFVADATCCHDGYGRDHFAPQAAFATYAERGVDVLLQLDAIEEGLDELTRRVIPSRNASCHLQHANSAEAKPSNIPRAATLRGALDDSLVRQLCNVYEQDFLCFGLARPAVCTASSQSSSSKDAGSIAVQPELMPRPPGLAAPATSTVSASSIAAPKPLATVMVLTCNRPKYVLLALRQIADQDYRPLEALVVDDGSADLEPLLRAAHPDLEVTRPGASATPKTASPPRDAIAVGGLVVRLLSMPQRASIGEKRTAAVQAARGDVILHWDDDDFHEPKRVGAQVGPIARGDADVTALDLSFVATLPRFDVYEIAKPGGEIILWSSLAYRSSLGRELGFANVSLGEDIHFADRAVRACHRMAVVSGVQSIYTRHDGDGLGNTYRAFHVAGMLRDEVLRKASPPEWLTPELAAGARNAESDATGRACPVVAWHMPGGFDPARSTVPRMASHCCASPADTSCAWLGGAQNRRHRSRRLMHYGVDHPPPPPVVALLYELSVEHSYAGDIADFDQAAYVQQLASFLNVYAEFIHVEVVAASVTVHITVTVTLAELNSATTGLEQLGSEGDDTLSTQFGVTLESATEVSSQEQTIGLMLYTEDSAAVSQAWEDARATCAAASPGAGLATISSAAYNSIVLRALNASVVVLDVTGLTFPVWLGASTDARGMWRWDGSNESLCYANWRVGHPPAVSSEPLCAALHEDGGWSAELCTASTHNFMCDLSNETTTYNSSATSLAYTLCAHPLTWDDAAASCAERGGGLATVRSDAELVSLRALLNTTYGDGDDVATSVWLGGTDAADGGWRWSSSTTTSATATSSSADDGLGSLIAGGRWAYDYTDQLGGGAAAAFSAWSDGDAKHCLRVVAGDLWVHEKCMAHLSFACEAGSREVAAAAHTAAATTATASVVAASDLVLYRMPASWAQAEANCASLAAEFSGLVGSLASLITAEEDAAARALLAADALDEDSTPPLAWTGGHTAAGGWIWTAVSGHQLGSAWRWNTAMMTYTAWAESTPLTTEDDRCSALSRDTGGWYDRPCELRLPYLCRLHGAIDNTSLALRALCDASGGGSGSGSESSDASRHSWCPLPDEPSLSKAFAVDFDECASDEARSTHKLRCTRHVLDQLKLHDAGLSGSVPSQLGLMRTVRDVQLHNNPHLVGPLPSQLGQLTRLVTLFADRGRLSGTLPSQLATARQLQTLDLARNGLSGTVPTQLGLLTAATHIFLDANSLTGVLPTEIGELGAAVGVHFHDNQLSGSVPTQLARLAGTVQRLSLLGNPMLDVSGSRVAPATRASLYELLLANLVDGVIHEPAPEGRRRRLLDVDARRRRLRDAVDDLRAGAPPPGRPHIVPASGARLDPQLREELLERLSEMLRSLTLGTTAALPQRQPPHAASSSPRQQPPSSAEDETRQTTGGASASFGDPPLEIAGKRTMHSAMNGYGSAVFV